MKPVDATSSIYIDFGMKNNEKDSKFKNGGQVRKSKYKNISAKGFVLDWSEEVYLIKKLKIMCRGPISLVILMVKKIVGTFYKKQLQKQIKMSLQLKN